jgi:hypothetical protein
MTLTQRPFPVRRLAVVVVTLLLALRAMPATAGRSEGRAGGTSGVSGTSRTSNRPGSGLLVHEIPANVTVLAFVRPEANRLRVLVRVPLEAIRDIEFPLYGPGYLDLARVEPLLEDAARVWIADYIALFEDDAPLDSASIVATRISLPSDRSFTDWLDALAHVTGAPLPAATQVVWQQAMLDILLEYSIASDDARFSIHPALAHLGIRTVTVLRFRPPGGAERVFQYVGDPGLVRLDPRWHQAAWRFVKLGFFHILDGIDHLLFVLCLVIPVRRFRPLLAIVTAFTVAHSITLVASAFGLAPRALWFPPLIETLIALSIVWMAFENIVGARLERRWIIAFAFGLVHGFGFSFLLRESMQFAGAHLITSLLAFNVGVELGQVLVLLLLVPALGLLFRFVVAERMGTILLSALVAHSAWHWMTDRAASLREFDYRMPVMNAAWFAALLRGLMLLLIVAGVVWLLWGLFARLLREGREKDAVPASQSLDST